MPPKPAAADSFEPRRPSLAAAAICTLAALTLLWPLLTGQILFGGGRSDMYIAGYSFRLFGAETFKATGSIPQWNPYLFGGLPYIAAMHGDIFYPTAWLRWIMPVDLAITWGMAVHLVLAGWLTYGLARSLKLGWSAAVVAGVSYELTGIVASQMSPGHDGKLFVSALTPLAFWVLVRAIRDGQRWAWGAFALVVALTVLGHYHMSYFLLIALALWTLYLIFWHSERPTNNSPYKLIGIAAACVVLGIGITALQVLPFMEYIKFSPRAEGGTNTGWAFATSYAMPPAEIFTLILPQFNGVLDNYWGQNPLKFHTEYAGFLPLALAALAWGDRARRRLVSALLIGTMVFLLFAFGGYSPLYKALFNVLPYLNKIRAMGMVFFLAAFPIALLAGIGFERVVTRSVSPRAILVVTGAFATFALLGAVGGLQTFAEGLAMFERVADAEANGPALRVGAVRLLLFVVLGGVALWMIAARKLKPAIGVPLIIALICADLWSINRQFYQFSPRASTLFADDGVTAYLKKIPKPYRTLEIGGSYGHSVLMAYGIPSALGYHGFELRAYDELAGLESRWENLFSNNLFDLLAVRYLIADKEAPIPGYHLVVPQTTTATGKPVMLYERDSVTKYARVIVTAAKVPENTQPSIIANPRFPVNSIVIYPDSASLDANMTANVQPRSLVVSTIDDWRPGRMSISLQGSDSAVSRLLISENYYPDWHATVDGKPGVVRRADHALLSVDLPAGARKVELAFESQTYKLGKIVSLVSVLIALAMIAMPIFAPRRLQAVT